MNRSEKNPELELPVSARRNGHRKLIELLAIAAFVVVNLLAPIVFGELYPFTVSPMFSDQPSQYCTYQIFDSAGQELDPEQFGLHLVYDGNPPGLGMGIVPKPTLHAFGDVVDESTVRQHVQQVMKQSNVPGPLTIKRTHVAGGEPRLKTTVDEWTVAPSKVEAKTP
jgi:hypothetical protein